MFKTLLLLIFSIFLSLHEFHISHTSMYYNENSDSLEITIKVPIEDLEKSLDIKDQKPLGIGTNKELESIDKKINTYIKKNLKLYFNGKNIEYQWVGKEIDDNLEEIYLYFEVQDCTQTDITSKIKIYNTVFFNINNNQVNIVLIEYKNKKINLNFTKDSEVQIFKLN